VERIGTTISSRSEERVVHNSSTKRGSSSSGKCIGSSTTKHEGSNNGSSTNTSNYTSSQTRNKSDREAASTSILKVASSVVGDVTARNTAVLRDWAHDGKDEATTVRITNRFVAYVGSVTRTGGVDAGISQIEGSGVATVDSAQVIVIAEIFINRREDTSNFRITRVISTGIRIIARRIRGINTLGKSDVTRVLTYIIGASVGVVTVAIGEAIRDRRAQIGEVDDTG